MIKIPAARRTNTASGPRAPLCWSWNERYEAGTAGPTSHSGHGGIDTRYDELDVLLASHRQTPDDAHRLVGEVRFNAAGRYRAEGLDY
ncbi:hypothetical protein ACSCBZ_21050 [Streptomyces niveiscabiei]|uniref:hypothetical protein n=1 Tax=Streptomyces TaxID=1883 RepID=UPI000A832FB1|nr:MULTISPECIES: hypothetical protein [Streptomyces]